MRIFLLFHDAALPHSRYLLEGFAAHDEVSQLTVAYPKGRGADLIFSAGSEFEADQAYPYQMVGLSSSFLRPKWVRWSSLLSAMRAAKPDYVIVLDEAMYPNTLLAGLAAWRLGINAPVVFYGFENIYQCPPWGWLREQGLTAFLPFLRKTLRYILFDRLLQPLRKKLIVGGLVSYSECAKIIKENGWIPILREQWWAVNTKLFAQAAQKQSVTARSYPDAWKIQTNQVVLGYVGRLVSEKGVEDLLQAIKELGNAYVLVCIGGGPQETEITRRADELGVKNQLRLMPPIPPSNLAEHVAAMDVLALPSHTDVFWKEQYGRVLVEAMAAGVPVVGSRSGAIPEVIGDNRRTFDEGKISQICLAIKAAESMTTEERKDLQKRAQKGEVSVFVQAYIDLYHQVRD